MSIYVAEQVQEVWPVVDTLLTLLADAGADPDSVTISKWDIKVLGVTLDQALAVAEEFGTPVTVDNFSTEHGTWTRVMTKFGAVPVEFSADFKLAV